MLRMVNLLIALSFGVHLEQFEQRMGFTWPRPFLLRPLFRIVSPAHRIEDIAMSLKKILYTWMLASSP